MVHERGPQSFEAEGIFSFSNGRPLVSDANLLRLLKERVKDGQFVRLRLDVMDDDDPGTRFYGRIREQQR